MPTSFQNKTYNVLVHDQSTLCRSHSSLYKEKTAKKWRNKALLRYSVQCTQYTLSIFTLYTFSVYMFKITMTLVCTISIGKVFNSVLNSISVLMYNSVLMCNNVLMYNNVLMCNNVLMHNSVLMYGSVITNPGQNATNQTRTRCHKTKTGQNATE